MSSQTRNERGDENRLDLRTLAIASISAAVAAIVVSRIWASGTPFAAAATPVIVTILKEMLDRPTAKIAEKVAVPARGVAKTAVREPAASHVGRDTAADEGPTRRLEPTAANGRHADGADAGAGDIRVYRQQPAGRPWGRINPKIVAITAALAFVIAGVVLTMGQLAIGNPFGSDGDGALILGQKKKSSSSDDAERQNTTTAPQQTTPETQQTTPQAVPDQQQTAPVEPEEQSAPGQTTPQVAPQQQPQTTPTTPQQR